MKAINYLIILLCGLVSACTNSDVTLVKGGVMADYNKSTIGQVFDASFDDAKWEALTGKKGERIVRFTGHISQDLHDSVIEETQQRSKSLKIYQQEELQIRYMQLLVAKQGHDSPTIKNLNDKYGCVLEEASVAGGTIWWVPKCQNNANWSHYLEDTAEAFLAQSWQVGDGVEVEWVITPDGKQYDISAMASSSWEGLEYEHILEAIYR